MARRNPTVLRSSTTHASHDEYEPSARQLHQTNMVTSSIREAAVALRMREERLARGAFWRALGESLPKATAALITAVSLCVAVSFYVSYVKHFTAQHFESAEVAAEE